MAILERDVPTLNEKMNFQRYINEKELTQAQVAKDLDIFPQMISRVLQNKGRAKLPPALKLALLKKYSYDVETDKEINYAPQENVTRIPFYPLSENYLPEDIDDSMCIYFDTRWLKHVMQVEPENLVMFQVKDQDFFDIFQYDSLKPIGRNDILMIDKSIKTATGISYFLVKQKNKYLIKCLNIGWDGDIEEIVGTNTIKNNMPKRLINRIKKFGKNDEIIGKVIWNSNSKLA